jgi:MinD superfamily P-loop ATPase
MVQLLILSGKGGTGKTTIAGAFIKLSAAKAYADCDVDAPNLHLIMAQQVQGEKSDFYGMDKAGIDTDLCVRCDFCRQSCRFCAIDNENDYTVDPFSCEGCGVCEFVCPAGAITMTPAVSGELILYTKNSVFSTAQLKMGSGNSGKLVSEVKKQMLSAAANAEFAVIDGSPGIGCPVIASISGADMVLIVAEPSVSGISDMERIIKTAKYFGIRLAVCVNKFDTNLTNTEKIEAYCSNSGLISLVKYPLIRKRSKPSTAA